MPRIMEINRSKKKAVGVVAGLLAFGGLAAISLPANADETSSATNPVIKLTSVDTDTVVASGRNFSANADISVVASSSKLSGTGTVRTGADGRFLVAFRLPAGFDDKLSVVSKTPDASASIDVTTPGSSTTTTAAPVSVSSTTTSTTSSTTSTTTPAAPQLASKLLALPGASDFNLKTDYFNATVAGYNAKVGLMNAKLIAASDTKYASVKSDLDSVNAKVGTLNTQTDTINKAIVDLNAKANAAKTQADLDALAPQLSDLTAKRVAQTATLVDLSKSVDAITDKLTATV